MNKIEGIVNLAELNAAREVGVTVGVATVPVEWYLTLCGVVNELCEEHNRKVDYLNNFPDHREVENGNGSDGDSGDAMVGDPVDADNASGGGEEIDGKSGNSTGSAGISGADNGSTADSPS